MSHAPFLTVSRTNQRRVLALAGLAVLILAALLSAWRPALAGVPDGEAEPNLNASYKAASIHFLAPGEELTYTIFMYNSGTVAATADVSDPLPAELTYVDGSVSGAGVYDAGTHSLTWSDLEVAPGEAITLTFAAGLPVETVIETPVVVTNTATIDYGVEPLVRSTRVVLVPESRMEDSERPVVHALHIGDSDLLESQEVQLHINATDNVGVRWMYLREWQIVANPRPHWQVVQSSGWVPFQEVVDWTLGDQAGVHFVGVWVADGALNRSLIDRNALDFANLMLPETVLNQRSLVPYLVNFEAGVEVTATLTPLAGDPDLYVWYPQNYSLPDHKSLTDGVEQVTFVTPLAGNYIFLVHAFTGATYNFAITSQPATEPALAAIPAGDAAQKIGEVTYEPVFNLAGIDPLGAIPDAPGMHRLYAPVVRH